MSNLLKIVVAGPIPRDTISTYENDIIMRYGCVTHPVIALSKLLDDEGVVVPVSNMHKKDEDGITSEFLLKILISAESTLKKTVAQ